MLHRIRFDRLEVLRDRPAEAGVHDTLFPDQTGQCTGVYTADSRDSLFLQKGVQSALTAEVRRGITEFPHHIALRMAGALKIFRDEAVVADHGEGLQDDLPGIAGVGQRLEISGHAGGKHQLSHSLDTGIDPLPCTNGMARKGHPVFQYQIDDIHSLFPFIISAL